MAIVPETVARPKPKSRITKQQVDITPRQDTYPNQSEWEEMLGVEKRIEQGVIVIYANDKDGKKRKMEVHDRPGGIYALSYTDDSLTTYATRVTGEFLDQLPISDYIGPAVDWRQQRELQEAKRTARRTT